MYYLLPATATRTATVMMAARPPFERENAPFEDPAAPASSGFWGLSSPPLKPAPGVDFAVEAATVAVCVSVEVTCTVFWAATRSGSRQNERRVDLNMMETSRIVGIQKISGGTTVLENGTVVV